MEQARERAGGASRCCLESLRHDGLPLPLERSMTRNSSVNW